MARLLSALTIAIFIASLGLLITTEVPMSAQSTPGAPLPVPGRSMVATKYGIVAASHPLAARAGVQILERGGHAVDAAIATNAVLNLMEPAMNGIGGDLFAIVYDAKADRLYGMNASGWSPSGLTPELLKGKGQTRVRPRHLLGDGPGRRRRLGTDAGTVRQAADGRSAGASHPLRRGRLPDHRGRRRPVRRRREALSQHPNARATYMLDGDRVPREGDIFRNPALATSLRRIATQGRDGFYRGQTAEAIVALSRELGGTMTMADLAEYRGGVGRTD